MAGLAGSAGSAGEFREAIFYEEARYFRHICSELELQFSTNLRKLPWAPQGTPRDPQGIPKGPPRNPMGPPKGPRAAQREPSGRQNQAKGTPKPVQGQPKQAKKTNYISTNSRSTACAAVMLSYHVMIWHLGGIWKASGSQGTRETPGEHRGPQGGPMETPRETKGPREPDDS